MTNDPENTQIEHRIRTFIAENLLFSVEGFAYSDDDSFLQEGIIDSLGVMQLVEFVQKDFQVTVLQQEIVPENFDTVARLSSYVRRKSQTSALENPVSQK